MSDLKFEKRKDFEAWLNTQPREVCVILAARAALRVAPLAASAAPAVGDAKALQKFRKLSFSIFFATALARVAAKYPGRANTLSAGQAVVYADAAADGVAVDGYSAAYAAGRAASNAVAATVGVAAAAASSAYVADVTSAVAFRHAVAASRIAIVTDANFVSTNGVAVLADALLWLGGAPPWAFTDWAQFQAALPDGEDWDVWFYWYNERLNGGGRSEAEEMLFATVPQELWGNPPAANRWIKERLPKRQTPSSEIASGPEQPQLPAPGPGPRMVVVDEQIDVDEHRPQGAPPQSKRCAALLAELREAVRDFADSFDSRANAHRQLRNVLERYRAQIDLDDPDIDVAFALGLRLENAARAAGRNIRDGHEATLEDGQQEALASVLDLHAVFMASEPEGAELLQAAERYAYRGEEDEKFKQAAEPVAESLESAPDLATLRAIDIVKGALEEMNRGETPARAGVIGRNTLQRALLTLGQAAISGAVSALAGQIVIRLPEGQFLITHGATFAHKAIGYLLNNDDQLRALAGVAGEGFAFLGRLIDWLRAKLHI